MCRLDPDDAVKVKMGRDNGEVFAEDAVFVSSFPFGDISKSATGTLGDPAISEAGRQFLANFSRSFLTSSSVRCSRRLASPFASAILKEESSGFATVDDWVAAFKAKREQILTARCSTS